MNKSEKPKHLLFSLLAALCTVCGVTPVFAQVQDVIENQTETIEAGARTQSRINTLDDETTVMLDEYRQILSQIEDLNVYNNQLQVLIDTQNSELADYDRKFADLEVTKRRILPLISRMIDVLDEFVQIDTPFLLRERQMRIEALRELQNRPDVPNSEKYRRVAEAYQIELDYGHTIEAYESEIDLDGQNRTVSLLRFGRLALYYLSLDGDEIGFWDAASDQWIDLEGQFRQPLEEAIRIASDQLPPDLIRLPVAAPEVRL